jgi:hypothetical protein
VHFALTESAPLAGRVVADGPVAHLAVALAGDGGTLQPTAGFYRGQRMPPLNAACEFRIAAAPVGKQRLRIGTPAQLKRGEFLREVEIVVEPASAGEREPVVVRL